MQSQTSDTVRSLLNHLMTHWKKLLRAVTYDSNTRSFNFSSGVAMICSTLQS